MTKIPPTSGSSPSAEPPPGQVSQQILVDSVPKPEQPVQEGLRFSEGFDWKHVYSQSLGSFYLFSWNPFLQILGIAICVLLTIRAYLNHAKKPTDTASLQQKITYLSSTFFKAMPEYQSSAKEQLFKRKLSMLSKELDAPLTQQKWEALVSTYLKDLKSTFEKEESFARLQINLLDWMERYKKTPSERNNLFANLSEILRIAKKNSSLEEAIEELIIKLEKVTDEKTLVSIFDQFFKSVAPFFEQESVLPPQLAPLPLSEIFSILKEGIKSNEALDVLQDAMEDFLAKGKINPQLFLEAVNNRISQIDSLFLKYYEIIEEIKLEKTQDILENLKKEFNKIPSKNRLYDLEENLYKIKNISKEKLEEEIIKNHIKRKNPIELSLKKINQNILNANEFLTKEARRLMSLNSQDRMYTRLNSLFLSLKKDLLSLSSFTLSAKSFAPNFYLSKEELIQKLESIYYKFEKQKIGSPEIRKIFLKRLANEIEVVRLMNRKNFTSEDLKELIPIFLSQIKFREKVSVLVELKILDIFDESFIGQSPLQFLETLNLWKERLLEGADATERIAFASQFDPAISSLFVKSELSKEELLQIKAQFLSMMVPVPLFKELQLLKKEMERELLKDPHAKEQKEMTQAMKEVVKV